MSKTERQEQLVAPPHSMRASAWDWKALEHCVAKDAHTCQSTGRKVSLAYRLIGSDAEAPLLVLICGLNSNLNMYHPAFLDALARAGPFRVAVFDNRDTGFSTKFDDCAVSSIPTFFTPRRLGLVTAPYKLADMADDVAGLLDHLGAAKAVVMGSSMGGMIAQVFALRHPHRTLSLVSMNSTTHGPNLPDPSVRTKLGFLRKPKDNTDDALIDLKTRWCRDFGCHPANAARPDFIEYFRTTSTRMVQRSRYDGFQRQMAAIITAPARDEALQQLDQFPALVIQGAADVTVLPPHGYRTAACLPTSRLVVYKDMGHVVDPDCMQSICAEVAATVRLATR